MTDIDVLTIYISVFSSVILYVLCVIGNIVNKIHISIDTYINNRNYSSV